MTWDPIEVMFKIVFSILKSSNLKSVSLYKTQENV